MSSFSFFKGASALILCVLMLVGAFSVSALAVSPAGESDMRFDCKSACLMDSATGTILYEYNADEPLPPASVTKIMTLLLVMEEIESGRLSYDDTIRTSAHAASMGGSQIFLREGEEMSAEDMIKSVVIASANDAAVALAEHICGSEEAFVAKMNARAAELGMKNTNFENTNGLDDTAKNHVTSARDIAIMSRELIAHEKILDFSSIWMDSIRGGEFGLTNTNRLVRFYQGATGLKTGSTAKAGFCVSATAKRGNMHLICVVMGAPSSTVRNDIAAKLLSRGFADYALYEDPSAALEPIRVRGGVEDRCEIRTTGFSLVVKRGDEKRIEKSYSLPDSIESPVARGECVGQVEYRLGGEIVGQADIISSVSIEKIGFWELFVRILSKFLIK